MSALLFVAGLALAAPESTAPAQQDAAPAEIQRWMGSVVMLVTGPGWCSGVIVDQEGTVATAYHCVASGRRPRVELEDGRSAIGRIVAARAKEDLALVSVPELAVAKGGPPPLAIRQGAPQRGERVYGLGHPYAPLTETTPGMAGLLRWSVTEGIVSNTGERYLQTDAALNPGNSGGPVVDVEGRVVGIVSRKLSGDNLAFAVNSDLLRAMIEAPERPSLLGGEVSFGLGLGTMTGVGDALTWSLRGTAAIRDRVVVSAFAGLPSGAIELAEAFGQSRYASAGVDLGARARIGRGRWSAALEAGPSLTFVGGYSAEPGEGALPDRIAPSLGGYGRVELSGLGVRVGVLALDGEPVLTLGVEIGAPIGRSTF